MLEWTVGTDKGKVVFKPGVVIPDKGEINLVIEPDQAIEIAQGLMGAALRIKGKMTIDAYHPRAGYGPHIKFKNEDLKDNSRGMER